jgi:membrane-bound lytic murein transglycosylase D
MPPDSHSAPWNLPPRRVISTSSWLFGAVLLAGCASTPPVEPVPVAVEPVAERVRAAPAPTVVIRNADGAALDIPQHNDIWERVRAGFGMVKLDSPLVAKHEQWFVNNPEFMTAMMDRAGMYLYYIVDEVEKRGMPMEIALLPAIESAFKPYAYSRAKAAGLWQFIPSTGRLYGLKANWWYDGRRDVAEATRAALDYLEKLRDDFEGDWHLALAAYNAGEGKVSRMIEYNRQRGLPTTYEHLKLRAETVNYVPRLLAFVNIVAEPEKYGVTLAHIPNSPYFARIETGSQIDLNVVAKLADLDVEHLHKINPGFNRRTTDPDGPHYLFVPVDKKELIEEALNNLPENERVQYRHHQVARGETLAQIAQRYNVSPSAIQASNRLSGKMLRVGQNLTIPLSDRPISPVLASQLRAKTVAASVRKPSGAKQPVIHRVRSGETLHSIARKYDVLVKQLMDWNLLKTSDVLRIGQRLKIWPPKVSSTAADHEPPAG